MALDPDPRGGGFGDAALLGGPINPNPPLSQENFPSSPPPPQKNPCISKTIVYTPTISPPWLGAPAAFPNPQPLGTPGPPAPAGITFKRRAAGSFREVQRGPTCVKFLLRFFCFVYLLRSLTGNWRL